MPYQVNIRYTFDRPYLSGSATRAKNARLGHHTIRFFLVVVTGSAEVGPDVPTKRGGMATACPDPLDIPTLPEDIYAMEL